MSSEPSRLKGVTATYESSFVGWRQACALSYREDACGHAHAVGGKHGPGPLWSGGRECERLGAVSLHKYNGVMVMVMVKQELNPTSYGGILDSSLAGLRVGAEGERALGG